MKYNFNVKVYDLDDQPLKDGDNDLILSKSLARLMYNAVDVDDTMKLMETWVRPMYRGEEIEMDDTDVTLFKNVLKNPKLGIHPVLKEAAIKVIRETQLKNEAKKAEKNGKSELQKAS